KPPRTGRSPPAREPAPKRHALLDSPVLERVAQLAALRLPRPHETIVLGARLGDAERMQLAQPEVAQHGVPAAQPLEVVPDVGPRAVHAVRILPRRRGRQDPKRAPPADRRSRPLPMSLSGAPPWRRRRSSRRN